MLKQYQTELAEQAAKIAERNGLVYLALQMRVGKTRIALQTCVNLGASEVLFVTKKKAIPSVYADFNDEQFALDLTVTNYENLGKFARKKYDVIIYDEAHSLGAFPKPSQRAQCAKMVFAQYHILCSGTPTPESYSQIFHQIRATNSAIFAQYRNFYEFARDFVHVQRVVRNGVSFNDYSYAKEDKIKALIQPIFLTYTQAEAGINDKIEEHITEVVGVGLIGAFIRNLKKERILFVEGGDTITADTPVKLLQKVHQLSSGTIITDSGERKVLDYSKAQYLTKLTSHGKKIAVFYKYIAEFDAITKILGSANITTSAEEFNRSEQYVFVSQITSGSMGVDLSTADELVFYNIDFSSVQYWQSRARIQKMDVAKTPVVRYLFSDYGIEGMIYDRVKAKKDFTTKYFLKNLGRL